MKDYKVNSYVRTNDNFTVLLSAGLICSLTMVLAWQEIYKYFGF